jgi:hypothetical protein
MVSRETRAHGEGKRVKEIRRLGDEEKNKTIGRMGDAGTWRQSKHRRGDRRQGDPERENVRWKDYMIER